MKTTQDKKREEAARKLAADNRAEELLRNRPKITFYICLAIAVAMTVVAWYKGDGFQQILRADKELKADRERVARLKAENESLRQDISKANKDMKRVEKFARENLNLVRENDLVFHFYEENSDYLSPNK